MAESVFHQSLRAWVQGLGTQNGFKDVNGVAAEFGVILKCAWVEYMISKP